MTDRQQLEALFQIESLMNKAADLAWSLRLENSELYGNISKRLDTLVNGNNQFKVDLRAAMDVQFAKGANELNEKEN